jgi:hypothetical protein
MDNLYICLKTLLLCSVFHFGNIITDLLGNPFYFLHFST